MPQERADDDEPTFPLKTPGRCPRLMDRTSVCAIDAGAIPSRQPEVLIHGDLRPRDARATQTTLSRGRLGVLEKIALRVGQPQEVKRTHAGQRRDLLEPQWLARMGIDEQRDLDGAATVP